MDIDVLISTVPYDIHAGAVSLAIKAHKGKCLRWYASGFPSYDGYTFYLGESSLSTISVPGKLMNISDIEIGAFWYRRTGQPFISANLHESDKDFSDYSCKIMRDMMLKNVCDNSTFKVNDVEAAHRVEHSKILQLKTAKKIGFEIPVTLISNSPTDIRNFIRSSSKRVIFKSFYFISWETENKKSINFTSFVSEDLLPSDEYLRACPGIFQHEVEKQFELRVNIFGNYVITSKINITNKNSATDWRVSSSKSPTAEYNLPLEIRLKCVKLIKELGLNYASIDMIVTPDDKYIFLEVNQQGQFLWLEEHNPELRLLDTFAQFLLSKDPEFSGPKNSPLVVFNEIRSQAWHEVKADLELYENSLPVQNYSVSEDI